MAKKTLSDTEKNFFRAYFEWYYGNDYRHYWSKYLTIVYLNAHGDIRKFNFDHSAAMFEKIKNRSGLSDYMHTTYISLCNQYPDVYMKFLTEKELFLKSKGFDYLCIYDH